MKILLFIHVIISILLVITILLQKTKSDSLSGLSGSGTGAVGARVNAGFLVRVTVVLAVLFLANSLVLANLSSRKRSVSDLVEKSYTVPLAK